MKKTAVVYDKWLASLGGGEVVACNMARILKDNGYEVTFISGKKVSRQLIKKILGIELNGIKFTQVWNDELSLKKLTQGKDVFINISFIDYCYGYAKKNIYYAHFPTKPYNSIRSLIDTHYIFPLLVKFMKPIEILSGQDEITVVNRRLAYGLEKPISIAFPYLEQKKQYQIRFSVFFETFSMSIIKSMSWSVENADVIKSKVVIDHHHNVIHYLIDIKPKTLTIYLKLKLKDYSLLPNKGGRVYLLNPKILPTFPIYSHIFRRFYERVNNKLRMGLFVDALKRLATYQKIITHSQFVKYWVKEYWDRDASVLYPPVEMFFKKYNLQKYPKKKWICSVGRFFTLGHGKKQEILVKAFKKLNKLGYKDWQLHLVGGVDNEPASLRFIKLLKQRAKGYPIYFHFNVSRDEVKKIILKSQIYWHATGCGENEKKDPVKFEHFGIAPVEALSAGCIPVLFDGGGLSEIIKLLDLDPESHLFKTKNELVDKTVCMIKKGAKNIDWTRIFNRLNEEFSLDTFTKKFLQIVESLNNH